MTTAVPVTSQAAERALGKLTRAELDALRTHLRRELRAEKTSGERAPRFRETPEVAAGARRMIRAVGERAAGNADDLAELVELRRAVDDELARAVAGARDPQRHRVPYSWADVGRVLGITRQAAQQKYGR